MANQQTSKEQLKLKLKAKEAEAKARMTAAQSVHKPQVVVDDSNAISYDQWWMSLTKRSSKLRPHLKEIFWADFKSRGCSKNETPKKFNDMLDIFGYKL